MVNKAGELKVSLSDAVLKNSLEKKTSLKQNQRGFANMKQTFIIPLLLSVSTSTFACLVVKK